MTELTIEYLMEKKGFTPNEEQKKAILHTKGPLHIKAGPGSGKTRVLLWRVVNLIAFEGVDPSEIVLTTFTNKGAKQLKDGLVELLDLAGKEKGKTYDISEMLIGTAHSICETILKGSRFNNGIKPKVTLMDATQQFFYVSKKWNDIFKGVDTLSLKKYFKEKEKEKENFNLINKTVNLFNRFSEERISEDGRINNDIDNGAIETLLSSYNTYLNLLDEDGLVDFSYLQEKAMKILESGEGKFNIKHVIVDEYQDTNFIQEQLYFKLAEQYKNICVVGDDDQAIYRFRGATVENFVNFTDRVKGYLDNTNTDTVTLSINYRSEKSIVDFYTSFMEKHNWGKQSNNGEYRLEKSIDAFSKSDTKNVVIGDTKNNIAEYIKKLIDDKKVNDPNQIALIYPSVKDIEAIGMIKELTTLGIDSYSPRSINFLENIYSKQVFGLIAYIFDIFRTDEFYHVESDKKFKTLVSVEYIESANKLLEENKDLKKYIEKQKNEVSDIQKTSDKKADWNLLDLFWELMSFSPFKEVLDSNDEIKLNNLSKVSNLINQYNNIFHSEISFETLKEEGFVNDFFISYLYPIFSLKEGEFEDEENLFPSGKVQFLTVHQAKGLEFPVVYMHTPKKEYGVDVKEEIIRELIDDDSREPVEMIEGFDTMRQMYVGFSRAENLLILPKTEAKNFQIKHIKYLVGNKATEKIYDIGNVKNNNSKKNKTYSYKGNLLAYERCPMQYKLFRKYRFEKINFNNNLFGTLIHICISDINEEVKSNINVTDNIIKDIFNKNYKHLKITTGKEFCKSSKEEEIIDQLNNYYSNFIKKHTYGDIHINKKLHLIIDDYIIESTIDLEIKDENKSKIYDIKTVASDKIKNEKNKYEKEQCFYNHLAKQNNKNEVESYILPANYKEQNNEVKFEYDKEKTNDRLEEFRKHIEGITTNKFIGKKGEKLCVSCYAKYFCEEVEIGNNSKSNAPDVNCEKEIPVDEKIKLFRKSGPSNHDKGDWFEKRVKAHFELEDYSFDDSKAKVKLSSNNNKCKEGRGHSFDLGTDGLLIECKNYKDGVNKDVFKEAMLYFSLVNDSRKKYFIVKDVDKQLDNIKIPDGVEIFMLNVENNELKKVKFNNEEVSDNWHQNKEINTAIENKYSLKNEECLVKSRISNWRGGNNTPSQKITNLRSDLYSLINNESDNKYLVIHKDEYEGENKQNKEDKPKKGETIANYFYRLNCHLIPDDVTVLEYDNGSFNEIPYKANNLDENAISNTNNDVNTEPKTNKDNSKVEKVETTNVDNNNNNNEKTTKEEQKSSANNSISRIDENDKECKNTATRCITIELGKTYYEGEKFNIRTKFEMLFGSHGDTLTISLENITEPIEGKIDRCSNSNKTPRIRISRATSSVYIKWLHGNFSEGDKMKVCVVDKKNITLKKV